MDLYKLVVYVPVSHADAVREALGQAGAGRIGNYHYCSFSVKGTGRFIPQKDAKPHIGNIGEYEQVEEERIEVTVMKDVLSHVIEAMKNAHPYEEIAYDLYSLVNK